MKSDFTFRYDAKKSKLNVSSISFIYYISPSVKYNLCRRKYRLGLAKESRGRYYKGRRKDEILPFLLTKCTKYNNFL